MAEMMTVKLGFVENFTLSGAAAIISKTAAAPVERVKLLMQNQNEMIKAGRLSEPYHGAIDCTVRTFHAEGLLPFWRGNLANCLRAAAGTLSLCFVYSLDYARTRLANDTIHPGKRISQRQFDGLVDVYIKTLKSDGIEGLYRGFVISCITTAIYRGLYFGLYDSLKPILLGENASLFVSFILGYSVTVCCGLFTYPLDTIRRRMMMTSGEAIKYKGSIDCAKQILSNEGFMSLLKGGGVNILRGIAGAGVLAGFDKFQALYIQWRYSALSS
ncbi:hypothetical protein C0Q70_16538 [Pomacea canaliculata]|uniref:ADP/ATP translocase n=1 Tax=Pomacea canaliculata TaxID=400727 RepID=A0A2T7NQ43_POMCA|nr:hypothetical protein C0Q70_16538 [Pomacea canaliculata]